MAKLSCAQSSTPHVSSRNPKPLSFPNHIQTCGQIKSNTATLPVSDRPSAPNAGSLFTDSFGVSKGVKPLQNPLHPSKLPSQRIILLRRLPNSQFNHYQRKRIIKPRYTSPHCPCSTACLLLKPVHCLRIPFGGTRGMKSPRGVVGAGPYKKTLHSSKRPSQRIILLRRLTNSKSNQNQFKRNTKSRQTQNLCPCPSDCQPHLPIHCLRIPFRGSRGIKFP